ncbi:sodium- and chloride-dependent glycine transporter 2-like [Limulus polyphemus]|uniref:Sodium- and chloride-dependent glycine transporter 2-like n=1 Tax=Limulus polyphemus TaxID=6850 RepID=A0ABM1TR36_LIMPO|nr:sodium- and chloride-dependent glycine transporter 2-like [Limulus polyphemus]
MVAIYYNVIISWTLFYFFDSFRSQVPWKFCHYWFNTESCFADQDWSACKAADPNNTFSNRTCFNATYSALHNLTDISVNNSVSAPEEYFNLYMLGKSEGFHDIGTVRWQLLLSLLVAWVVVAACLIKGIKTSGRVIYFTATFPYLILLILFIRGITLDGAIEGLKFYIIPDFSKLSSIGVWEDAAIQVFYSFSIAGGGMITYASYNKFTNNLVRDALIIGIGDMLTSIFSGMVVFSILGFMARQLNKSVADVVESGTGLAFIVYPDGIARMPVSILWALLFFFMLFLLGIDSQFAMVETVITFVFDQFPKTRAFKPTVVIVISIVLFLCGLPLTTNGGVYILEVIDAYAAGWPYMFIGLLECLVVAYVYGVENFLNDLKQMTGWCPGLWVRTHLMTVIMTVSPILICVSMLVKCIMLL